MNVTIAEVDRHVDAAVRTMIRSPEFSALIRSLKLESNKKMGDALGNIDPARLLSGNHSIPATAIDDVAVASKLKITADVMEGMLDVEKLVVYGSINIHL